MATLSAMNKNVSLLRSSIAVVWLVCLLPLAQAQWSWRDASGSRVFSDQPPPLNVAEKDILKRPPGARAPVAPSEATASTPAGTGTTATAPKISGKDSELEKKKKEAEAKEAAEKKANDQKAAAAKTENCDRAKRAKASFDSGTRISTTNAKGEREVMDEATRAFETKRLQEIIGSDCK